MRHSARIAWMTEMAHRYETGLQDTCVVIDADEVDEAE